MNPTRSIYHGPCFRAEIISHAVFVYHRFFLSLRDVEALLAMRGVIVSYETIRRWCHRFGPLYSRRLRKGVFSGCCAHDKFFAQEEPSLSIRRTSPPTMSGTPVIVIHDGSLLSSDDDRDETDCCTGPAHLEIAARFRPI